MLPAAADTLASFSVHDAPRGDLWLRPWTVIFLLYGWGEKCWGFVSNTGVLTLSRQPNFSSLLLLSRVLAERMARRCAHTCGCSSSVSYLGTCTSFSFWSWHLPFWPVLTGNKLVNEIRWSRTFHLGRPCCRSLSFEVGLMAVSRWLFVLPFPEK